MTARFFRYIEKVFGWGGMMERVRDSRPKPQISGSVVLTSLLLMFATRLGSLNALGVQLRVPERWKRVLGSRLPSADTLARVGEKLDTECLRDFLCEALHRLRRMKVLADNPWALRFLVFDGHEFFSQ
jgi:hypothetical protein